MLFRPKIVCVAVFVFAFTLTGSRLFAQPGRGPAAVAVGKVVTLRLAGTDTFVGTIQPLKKSVVGTAVDGRVVMIDLKPGDPVGSDPSREKPNGPFFGQPVAQLRTGTLEIEIESAEIQLQIAHQALEELQISLPKTIDLAGANAKVAEAALQYAQNNFERLQRLKSLGNAVSIGELEQARSEFVGSQESANAARIDYDKLNATRELQLAQAQLQVQAAKQEVKRLNDLKAKYTIRAPFEGLITQKLTDVGEWVTKGQPIVEVVQLDPIQMIINAPQEHLRRLQQSLAMSDSDHPLVAQIKIEGYEKQLNGNVTRIVAQADLRSRTFPVRIEIHNPVIGTGYALQPGMLGRATLIYGQEQDMNFVKKDALVLGNDRASVFKILEKDGQTTVTQVPVQTGVSLDDWIQVKGDVSPEDKVVLLGNERLKPGQPVKVTHTMDDVPR